MSVHYIQNLSYAFSVSLFSTIKKYPYYQMNKKIIILYFWNEIKLWEIK